MEVRPRKATGRCSPTIKVFISFFASWVGEQKRQPGYRKPRGFFLVIRFLFGELIMSLKKSLRKNIAQSTVEYLILFAIIAVLTLLSITEVFPRLKSAGEGYFTKAVNALD